MKLSDFFNDKDIIRDATFRKTMFPATSEPYSVCYAAKQLNLEEALNNSNISAIITTKELAFRLNQMRGLVAVDNPQLAYYRLHNHLVDHNLMRLDVEHFIHPTAQIAPTAIIGRPVFIGERATIGDGAVIGDYTVIGADTYVDRYVVTSVRGMQDTRVDGGFFPLKYAGGVRIGSRCQILSGSIIQRPYQAYCTEIGDDSIISLRVIVGHGVKIGRGCMVAGSAQIAGNVTIGERVWIGPSATISDGISIGDGSQVKIGSVVVEDVKPGQQVSGNFAVSHKRLLRIFSRIKNGEL